MTVKEFQERLDQLVEGKDENGDDLPGGKLDPGSNLRVLMPGGDQLDVLTISTYDAAAREKGEKYVAIRLDSPTA